MANAKASAASLTNNDNLENMQIEEEIAQIEALERCVYF